MENKTPIQTAIEKLKRELKGIEEPMPWESSFKDGINTAISILQSLLPAEKKLLEDTWKAGQEHGYRDRMLECNDVRFNKLPDLNQYLKQFNY